MTGVQTCALPIWYPVVSYGGGGNLKILHCNDVNCAGGNESIVSVDTVGTVGEYNSLQLDASGYPVVSYYDGTNGDLKILHCNDVNCEGGNESIVFVDTVDPPAMVGLCTSLQLDASGYPVVSYWDYASFLNGNLKVLHCDDKNCDDLVSTGGLVIATGTEDIVKDNATYTRWFSVENVYRSATGTIVESGGTEDPSTQKITAHATWPFFGDTAEVQVAEYMTRWVRNETTRFTEWGGASGVGGPVTRPDANYSSSSNLDFSTPGEIKLQ